MRGHPQSHAHAPHASTHAPHAAEAADDSEGSADSEVSVEIDFVTDTAVIRGTVAESLTGDIIVGARVGMARPDNGPLSRLAASIPRRAVVSGI